MRKGYRGGGGTVTARLLTKCSNTLRKIQTNARENITRTRAKLFRGPPCIIQFHLYRSVNIYSNWLQEQFCNLSLYTLYILNFMFAPCINNIKHFIVQLMYKNYKILRLLKWLKL